MYKAVAGNVASVEALYAWIYRELQAIEQSFYALDLIQLAEQNVAPTKPRTGMTMLADGTNWNPGSGAGVYTYYGGAWHKLG